MSTDSNRLIEIAKSINRTPAQVAINWIARQSGIASTLIGVSSLSQLEENLQSFEFEIPIDLFEQLDELSRPDTRYPYFFHTGDFLAFVNAQTHIKQRS